MNMTLAEELETLKAENAALKSILHAGRDCNIAGEDAHFSPAQRKILSILNMHLGKIVSKETIWNYLYSHRPECDQPSGTKMIHVFLCDIRKKLKRHRIKTISRDGFSMLPLKGK